MATSRLSPLLSLERGQAYSRAEVRDLFEPNQPNREPVWRQSGIVQTPSGSGDFVFFVTLGGEYEDKLYEDGFLLWKSQKQQSFKWADIRRFIAHDATRNNIHVFIRTPGKARPYVYLGLAEYVRHDPLKESPCEFLWRIVGWDLTAEDLNRLELPAVSALAPIVAEPKLPSPTVELKPTKPPKRIQRMSTAPAASATSDGQEEEAIDWAAREERNRALGSRGEELVMRYEVKLLKDAGKHDLAEKVKRVSLFNSRAGYDIRSFEVDGREKLIEVKTTTGPRSAAFFISANEVRASALNPDSYCIYRVYGLVAEAEKASFYVLKGDVTKACELNAAMYVASPRSDE